MFRKKCCEIRINIFANFRVLYIAMLIRELVHTMRKSPTFTISKSRSFYLDQRLSYATLNANDTKVTFFHFWN